MTFDEDKLKDAIQKIVKDAAERDELETLSKKTLLRAVRDTGLFDEEVTNEREFKDATTRIGTELVQKATEAEESKGKPSSTKDSRKRKSDDAQATKSRPTKKARTAIIDSEDEEEEKPPVKKAKRKSVNIADSDSEDSKPNKRKKAAPKPKKSADVDEDDTVMVDVKTKTVPKVKTPPDESKAPKQRLMAADAAELSDSALSVLDASPKKTKQTKKSTKTVKEEEKPKKTKKGAAKGKENSEDPDSEEIKRLKGFVIACGVRKRWQKEFEGIEDKPKKQIAHLKDLLKSLGMTGRLSMEKAKAIRAKRELAEEIQDVVAFDAKRGLKSETKSSSEPMEFSDREIEPAPKRKRNNILAFLDDQSDDE